jgi:hypothetical protein
MPVLRNPARDECEGASISVLVAQITPELQRVVRTCDQPLLQIQGEQVQFAGLGTTRRPFRKLVGDMVATYSLPTQVELRRNCPITHALSAEFLHLFILRMAT